MALQAIGRAALTAGKKLLGRGKTPWRGEAEDAAALTKAGTRRKPKWKGESGYEHTVPKRTTVSQAAKRRRKKKTEVASRYGHDPAKSRRRKAAAVVTGAAVGAGAGIGLSKKKPITGAGMDVPKTKGMSSYKVKKGDTLSEIAQKTGTTVKQLKNANPQIKNINKIKVGQTIKIPSKKRNRKSVYEGLKKSEMKATPKYHGRPLPVRRKSGGLIGMGSALRGGGAVRSR